jgi:hypothetical protein
MEGRNFGFFSYKKIVGIIFDRHGSSNYYYYYYYY